MDPAEFSRRIRLYANRAGELGDRAVMAASSAVLHELVQSTPVDTGRAISNWQVGVGSAPADEIPPHVPGTKGSTAEANRSIAEQLGDEQLAGYVSGRGQAIHIVNNAKHIGALNDGHSRQAPAGFVEAAVQRGRAAVRGVRVGLN